MERTQWTIVMIQRKCSNTDVTTNPLEGKTSIFYIMEHKIYVVFSSLIFLLPCLRCCVDPRKRYHNIISPMSIQLISICSFGIKSNLGWTGWTLEPTQKQTCVCLFLNQFLLYVFYVLWYPIPSMGTDRRCTLVLSF